ncbi:MAG: alpha-L-fucosidase [Planctomycetota bacterium]|jgi:alpha-L-fucosidase
MMTKLSRSLPNKDGLWKNLGLLFFLVMSIFVLSSCLPEKKISDSKASLQDDKPDMQWWRDAKFGLFIHWDPVSLKGTEISWSRKGPRRGRVKKGTGNIPMEEYDNLYKKFNPVKFDAEQWVQIAKDAGMKYLVFTTKHHDGFSMYDTKLSDYKISNTPFKRDVCRELADACHKAGIKLGWYYSPADWYDSNYFTENHHLYNEFYLGQLRELCTDYGRVDILWFDGMTYNMAKANKNYWGDAPERSHKMLRSLQPGIILNPRGGWPGDFGTSEQRIGSFNKRPWESCITICKQWSWKPDDEMKSLKQCLQTLVYVVGGDGNLLFNVGPMPTGEIEARQVERLREMGSWLRKYGESVYSTRGGPFKPNKQLASTHRDNIIYLHILDWQKDIIELNPIDKKIKKASLLTGGNVKVEQKDDVIEVSVPKCCRQDIDTIVKLELDRLACEIEPVKVRETEVQ